MIRFSILANSSNADIKDKVSTTVEASNFTYNTNGDTTGETTTTYSTETQNGTSFDVRTTLTKAYSYDYTDMMSAATVNESVDAKISGTSDSYTNSDSDSATDTYIYNGDGQRVKKITGGVTTKYYYTGSVVLYTADADNNKISGNIPTPSGQIIATRDYANATNSDGSTNTFANNYYFYHYDIRGSVTTLLKPDATIEQGYSYDEYGNATVENSASLFHNEMSYTGAISDSTTGLSYMNARYYNPATGTFTSQDTYYGSAYSPWTQHLYSYTGGNPVNYVDPTGHRFVEGTEIGGHVESNAKDQAIPQESKVLPALGVVGSVAIATQMDGPLPLVDMLIILTVTAGLIQGVPSGSSQQSMSLGISTIDITGATLSFLKTKVEQLQTTNKKSYSVYTLKDPATDQVMYVGRTCNLDLRQKAHEASLTRGYLVMDRENAITGLNYYEARIVEQSMWTIVNRVDTKKRNKNEQLCFQSSKHACCFGRKLA